ncbi:MAG: ATP-binding protein [Planctomycetota bacterium]
MIPKPLEQIDESVLRSLIADAVAEGKTIDYKRELPGSSDADKKEFLADVSSFANTSGGDLVFGVGEDEGMPTQIVGVESGDLDFEICRLDSIVASGLEPRIRYGIRLVTCQGGCKVLVIRVERSWVGPHRVIFKGHDKFYGRNSAGKYPLDVAELRAEFTLSETVVERIRAFRTDRIIALSNNQTPVPFTATPKLVLHCIPIQSFASRRQYDLLQFDERPDRLPPMAASGWSRRINLEGIVCYSGSEPAYSYVQVYRNGVLEAVHGSLLGCEYRGERLIPSIAYEKTVYEYLPHCFRVLKEIGCNVPIVVAVSLTNVRGLRMGDDRHGFDVGHAIDVDTLILPETVVEDFGTPPGKILKPIFDLVWNACGYRASKNLDSEGNWVRRS